MHATPSISTHQQLTVTDMLLHYCISAFASKQYNAV
jgi:hypothetical protein